MAPHIDHKAKKITGIVCDICGAVFTDKFEYYSAKFDLVNVDRAAGVSGIKSIDRRNLDLDFCKGCMDAMKQKVIDGANKREKNGTWSASGQLPGKPK